MNKVSKIIRDGVTLKLKHQKERKFNLKLYESNISPFIRFIHQKEIQAAGWVKIPKNKYVLHKSDSKTSTCQIDVSIDFNDIRTVETNDISPMLVYYFDIECSFITATFRFRKKIIRN